MYKPHIEDLSKDFILETLDEIRLPLEVAVMGSKNEFNIGGIIRTCHNFLVSKIHLVGVEWFYEKGAMSTLKWEKKNIIRWKTEEDFLAETQNRNLVAFERRDSLTTEDLRIFRYPDKPILMFGNEDVGLSPQTINQAKSIVTIPMLGLQFDHNISTSVGIAVYDFYYKHSMRINK